MVAVKLASTTRDLKGKLETERANSRGLEYILNNMPLPDSQRTVVNDYITSSNTKDTLCDSLTGSYENTLKVKDQQLTEGQILYSKLRTEFDTAVADKSGLINYNKTLQKQVRKAKNGGRIWKWVAVGLGLFTLQQQLK